jgi:hypothetical protein
MNRVQNFLADESGVTAIEYALIASLIAVFIISAVAGQSRGSHRAASPKVPTFAPGLLLPDRPGHIVVT